MTMYYKTAQMDAERIQLPMSVRVSKDTRANLQRIARRHNVKVSALVREAVRRQLPVWEKQGVSFGI